jgi:hypothetical protein
LARCGGEFVKNIGNLGPIFLGKSHPDNKADHGEHFLNPG